MVMSKDITFDFGRDCIKGASFSMSKGFYGGTFTDWTEIDRKIYR